MRISYFLQEKYAKTIYYQLVTMVEVDFNSDGWAGLNGYDGLDGLILINLLNR